MRVHCQAKPCSCRRIPSHVCRHVFINSCPIVQPWMASIKATGDHKVGKRPFNAKMFGKKRKPRGESRQLEIVGCIERPITNLMIPRPTANTNSTSRNNLTNTLVHLAFLMRWAGKGVDTKGTASASGFYLFHLGPSKTEPCRTNFSTKTQL